MEVLLLAGLCITTYSLGRYWQARHAAETCGCRSCQAEYARWQDWCMDDILEDEPVGVLAAPPQTSRYGWRR